MITSLLQGLMSLIMGLVKLILLPIDLVIATVLPDLSTALSSFGQLMSYISLHIGWVISFTGLSHDSISLIVMFLEFKLTAPIMFYTIKLALKWYDRLKP